MRDREKKENDFNFFLAEKKEDFWIEKRSRPQEKCVSFVQNDVEITCTHCRSWSNIWRNYGHACSYNATNTCTNVALRFVSPKNSSDWRGTSCIFGRFSCVSVILYSVCFSFIFFSLCCFASAIRIRYGPLTGVHFCNQQTNLPLHPSSVWRVFFCVYSRLLCFRHFVIFCHNFQWPQKEIDLVPRTIVAKVNAVPT